MNKSKWEAFLSDPELVENSNQLMHPEGQYLFEKIKHDVLECLNTLKGLLALIAIEEDEFSSDFTDWYSSKRIHIESIIQDVYLLWEPRKELPKFESKWPEFIQMIGSKLDRILDIEQELDELKKTFKTNDSDIVTVAIANITGLSSICKDIQAEEYKRLWTIRRYPKL